MLTQPAVVLSGFRKAPFSATLSLSIVTSLAWLIICDVAVTTCSSPSLPGFSAIWLMIGARMASFPLLPTPSTKMLLSRIIRFPCPSGLSTPPMFTLPMMISGAEMMMRSSSRMNFPGSFCKLSLFCAKISFFAALTTANSFSKSSCSFLSFFSQFSYFDSITYALNYKL